MIESGWLLERLQHQDLGFFCGVPDSVLQSFCRLLTQLPPQAHSIAADEGAALAEAAGHTLASGRPAVVYLQNSGFGNLVNPLVSLLAPDVCHLPVLLLIGWRGAPGCADEPQHRLAGASLPALLTALEIPATVLPPEPAAADALIAGIGRELRQRGLPQALLVRPGTLAPEPLTAEPRTGLSRRQALLRLLAWLPPQAVLFATTGHTCRELAALRIELGQRDDRDFLNVGAMGHTAAIALGFARARPDLEVVCLDGDGALLMHLGTLAAVGRLQPPRWTHVLLNNGVHDSVGAQPVANPTTDFRAIAAACGYRSLERCSDAAGLDQALARLGRQPGPRWLEVQTQPGSPPDLPRPATGPRQRVLRLQQSLEEPDA